MIGVYGGTFDPIHFGHLRPAQDVCDILGLTCVRFVPAYKPPLRGEPVTSPELRAKMVAIAIKGNKQFTLDRRELDREGPSWTIDTLESIRKEIGNKKKLILILGTDAFSRLSQWHRWEALLRNAHIAVMQRAGDRINTQEFPGNWLQRHLITDVTDLDTAAGKVIECPVTALDISSTRIRDLIKNGKSIRYLVPDQVADTINKQHLYI